MRIRPQPIGLVHVVSTPRTGQGPVAGLTMTALRGTLVQMTSDGELKSIDHVRQRLCESFPSVDAGIVDRVVWQAHHHFRGHPTREFVPILVEDAARDILRVMPVAGWRRQ